MISMEQVQRLLFAQGDVLGEDGKKIGTTGQVFLDAGTGDPAWVTVRTGLFGSGESFVPLADAATDGDAIRVPYTKDQVKHAPRIDSADGRLSPAEERDLYRHYGLVHDDDDHDRADDGHVVPAHATAPAHTTAPAATDRVGYVEGATPAIGVPAPVLPPTEPVAAAGAAPGGAHALAGDPTHAPVTVPAASGAPTAEVPVAGDDSMVIQQERLRVVGTERVPTERVRLKRYTVTEMREITVPVSREEFRVEYEPAEGDTGTGIAMEGVGEPQPGHAVPGGDPTPGRGAAPNGEAGPGGARVLDRDAVRAGDRTPGDDEVDTGLGLNANSGLHADATGPGPGPAGPGAPSTGAPRDH